MFSRDYGIHYDQEQWQKTVSYQFHGCGDENGMVSICTFIIGMTSFKMYKGVKSRGSLSVS